MSKFKVGDEVYIDPMSDRLAGRKCKVVKVQIDGSNQWYQVSDGETTRWPWNKYVLPVDAKEPLELASSPVQFILQYELDSDPFETFATMKDVEARIKELAARPDLKRESIKVYEVAKTYSVKLDTKVTMSVEGVEEEKPRTRRAHKKHLFKKECPDCGEKFEGGQGLAAHRRWNHKAPASY